MRWFEFWLLVYAFALVIVVLTYPGPNALAYGITSWVGGAAFVGLAYEWNRRP